MRYQLEHPGWPTLLRYAFREWLHSRDKLMEIQAKGRWPSTTRKLSQAEVDEASTRAVVDIETERRRSNRKH